MIIVDDRSTGEAKAVAPGFGWTRPARSLAAALVVLSALAAPGAARAHDRGQSTSDIAIFGRSSYTCPAEPTELLVSVGLLTRMPGWHRHFVKIDRTDGEVQQAVLTSDRHVVTVTALPRGASSTAFDFLLTGIEHILVGYDHIFFLLGLIVLTRRLRQILGLVTAFTVGHSITLILTTFLDTPEAVAVAVEIAIAGAAGVIVFEYGPRWRLAAAAAGTALAVLLGFAAVGHLSRPISRVEMLIALSVVFVGVENFFFDPRRRRWLLVPAFGSVHGFGFASVLSELHLPSAQRVLSLLSFNAGVEIGQIMIAAVTFPRWCGWPASRPAIGGWSASPAAPSSPGDWSFWRCSSSSPTQGDPRADPCRPSRAAAKSRISRSADAGRPASIQRPANAPA